MSKEMIDVPIGTEMIYRHGCSYARKGKLLKIYNWPNSYGEIQTRFMIEFEDGTTKMCMTHKVNIIGWSPNEEDEENKKDIRDETNWNLDTGGEG